MINLGHQALFQKFPSSFFDTDRVFDRMDTYHYIRASEEKIRINPALNQ